MKFYKIDGGNIPQKLLPFISDAEVVKKVGAQYPVVLSDYWLSIASGREDDPILAQALPSMKELTETIPGDEEDPFTELSDSSPLPGLVHRFPDRVLVYVSDTCAMRCRHCTRKNLIGTQHVPTDQEIEEIKKYILVHPKVREVLLSGGDPLMLSDEVVAKRVEVFAELPQLYSIRIGTRVPSTLPERITVQLAEILGKTKKVWINTQFNHPNEITEEAEKACALLVDAGIPVSCQTVLLKGINDNPDILEELFRNLQRIRVRPYYAFCGDPVKGTAHFRVTEAEAKKLEREVALRVGGLALPRFVKDEPTEGRKRPI